MKLSIITINYNNAEGLRKTMESVFTQTCKEFEYIVIDGGSTDDSVEVIKEYIKQLENFQWLSEPDKGIYNAMNKGVRMSKGEYTLMLNSGDFLVDEHVVERIIPALDGSDIVQGNIIIRSDGGKFRNCGYGKSDLDLFDVMKGRYLHQASFCRRDLFERYGYFDESYRIAADTKFFMLCLGRYDASYKYINVDVADYDITGISSDNSEKWVHLRQEEFLRIMKEVFSKRIYSFMLENDKKLHLYNNLHSHKWIWYLTMAIAHVNDWLYKGKC